MQPDEIYFLATTFQQAKKTFYNYHELNEFEANQDFDDFASLATRYPEFLVSDFEAAIRNAYKAQINKREDPPVGVRAQDVTLSMPSIRFQCEIIQGAKNIQKTQALNLPPKSELNGAEWMVQIFPELYKTAVAINPNLGTFPPLWAKLEPWHGQAMQYLTEKLKNSPEFHEGAKDIARREARNIFISTLSSKVEAIGKEPYFFIEKTIDKDYDKEERRNELQQEIDQFNMMKTDKVKFRVNDEWTRAKGIAAVKAYARIFHRIEPDAVKGKAVSNGSMLANLKELGL